MLTNRPGIFVLLSVPFNRSYAHTHAVTAMQADDHKKPGRLETRLSLAVVVVLTIIGLGVVRQQSRINPAVLALRPEARQQGLSQGSGQPTLIAIEGTGISPFSPPERFGPDTLYEKINGRADLYLSSGFVTLETQRFVMDGASGSWVEVFVYDMATPENAFSVFSMQRREDAQGDDIAPNAYRTANALFMAHANFYLEFIGTDDSENLQQIMGVLARAFLDAHGGTTAIRAPGAEYFPQEDVEPDSLQLITANAFGYEQLDQVYTCAYNIEGHRLTAFVSRRPDAGAAAALAAAFEQTMRAYGATSVDGSSGVDGAVALQFFDTYEIVFSRGPFLAGIHEADNLAAAATLAGRLAAHLEISVDR